MNDLTTEDAQHLQILSIFHYVVGGLMALAGCFPIIHLAVGISFLSGLAPQQADGPPARLFGLLFTLIPAFIMLLMWTTAVCVIFAGLSLASRRRYTFCVVAAALETVMCIPFGTALGVFTIIVLQRPSVKAAFGRT